MDMIVLSSQFVIDFIYRNSTLQFFANVNPLSDWNFRVFKNSSCSFSERFVAVSANVLVIEFSPSAVAIDVF
jgi:hypothetical protein